MADRQNWSAIISSPISPWCSAQSHYPATTNAASVSPKLEIDGMASHMCCVAVGAPSLALAHVTRTRCWHRARNKEWHCGKCGKHGWDVSYMRRCVECGMSCVCVCARIRSSCMCQSVDVSTVMSACTACTLCGCRVHSLGGRTHLCTFSQEYSELARTVATGTRVGILGKS